jgi:hypothetical protein
MGFRQNAIVAACLVALSGAAAAQQPRWHLATPEQRAAAEAQLARYTSPTLTRFAGEEEFRRYLGAVLALNRARSGWYAYSGRIQFAAAALQDGSQSDTVEPICPDSDPMCGAAAQDESNITVTGSRVGANARQGRASAARALVTSNPSITNNQMRGVEEGDIVKQIGNFLLVLQDGRIFVVDTRARGGRGLALADRVDVYRDPRENMWYDEMLVFGERVLITGYSYRHNATELSVFRLDEAGRLSREGVFYISSNDYYSTSNYATRLIGDNLVIYTPFRVSQMAQASFRWPTVRRWVAERREGDGGEDRPLFDAAQIYRPARDAEDASVHTVSVCPLGPAGAGRALECRTTAFVGPNTSQWYVTETDAFLWMTGRAHRSFDSQSCDLPGRAQEEFDPALLYRVPVDGAAPGLVGARGVPPDQFSLHASDGRFRALLRGRPFDCRRQQSDEARLAFLDLPLSGFGDTVREVAAERYTAMPGVKSHYIANRFTDRYLVYGSLGQHRRGLSEESMPPAYAVPVERPAEVRPIEVGHTIIRAEQAGNDIVVTGYRDLEGLVVTLIDLDARPNVASSVQLARRFESEGRSHAFNSLIEEDGSGVMGMPTIGRESGSARAVWRSGASDLSFLEVDRRGRLRAVGELRYASGNAALRGSAGYSCEVSCIDWYGNSRPIFTDGRLFALTGTELIEGRIEDGRVREVQRLNIARPLAQLAVR